MFFYTSVSTLVSCGSSNSDSGAFAGGDGSNPGPHDGASGGGGDGGVTAEAGGSGPRITLLVHGSADVPDFRVCFGATDDADGGAAPTMLAMQPFPSDPNHPMPRTNYPGVPAGSGVILDVDATTAKSALVPFLVNAETLATKSTLTGKTCDQIFCGSGASCLKTTDYDTLPAIPKSAVSAAGSRLLVVEGCRAGTAAPERCGAGYNASTGNLAMHELPLDGFAASGTSKLGVQVAQLSPSIGMAQMSFGALDGGTSLGTIAFGAVAPQIAAQADRPTSDPGFESTGLSVRVVSDAGSGASYSMSLAQIATASDPTRVPGDYFAGGTNFVLVVLGDPSYPADDAGTQLVRGLHAIALPSTTPRGDGGSL